MSLTQNLVIMKKIIGNCFYQDESQTLTVESVNVDELISFCESQLGPLDQSRSTATVEHLEIQNPSEEINLEGAEEEEYPSAELERILNEDIKKRQCLVHLVKILNRRPLRVV